jgi:hypothetical protein
LYDSRIIGLFRRTGSAIEMWTCAHRLAKIPAGKTLGVIVATV